MIAEHNIPINWIECDSLVLVNSFHSPDSVPWSIAYSVRECKKLIAPNVSITHVFREGNGPANRLAATNLSEGNPLF